MGGNDEMIVTGDILPAAIVSFDTPVNGETLLDNTFSFKGSSVDLGLIPLGSKITPISKNIYVNTNSSAGVTMEIDDSKPFLKGSLMNTGGTATIGMKYSLMGSAYTIGSGNPVDLVTTVNSGLNGIGIFKIEQSTVTSADQIADTYTVTLNVAIVAK
jgi:hypothetical protein